MCSSDLVANPKDGSATATLQTPPTQVQGGPNLTGSAKIATDLNGGALEPGDTLEYVITLNNTGKFPTGQMQISDPLDANLEAVSNVSSGGAFDLASNSVLWSLPAIPAGGAAQVSFRAKVKAGVANGTTIANSAKVVSNELPGPFEVSANVKVQAAPDISTLQLTVAGPAGGSFQPGDQVTYTATVQSGGGYQLNLPQADLPADGNYTLEASVSNAAGTPATPATRALSVDATAPVITITSVAGDTITTSRLTGEFDAVERGALSSNTVTTRPTLSGTTSAEVGQTVSIVLDGDRLRAEVSDRGRRFDPLREAPPPDLDSPLDERRVGGLGIHLVKKLMDLVDYQWTEGWNRVRVEKRIGSPPAGEPPRSNR